MSQNRDYFFKYQAPTSPTPLGIEVARAEHIYLYDTNGKRYTDLISGISVANLGHQHPEVIKAIHEQVDKYLHVMVYGEYIQEPTVLLAKKLAEVLPQNLNTSYFVNSGTEANEAAIKLAKRYTGRSEIVSFKKSYHGNTQGSLSVTGNEVKKNAFRPLIPGVTFLDFNAEEQLTQITEKTAGVIIEPIQGDAGIRLPNPSFLQALRKRCDETGALLIFDEIQSGMGRTGKLFAFEHYKVVPDVLTLAKAFGGGLPIGAFISSHEKMKTLSENPMLGHITTFGGNPVCCAAALASLNVLTQTNLVQEAEEKGQLIEQLLSQSHAVKEIRRKGLFMAIEMETADKVYDTVQKCIAKGIIAYWFLSCPNAFRLAPPLVITKQEIKEACEVIVECMK